MQNFLRTTAWMGLSAFIASPPLAHGKDKDKVKRGEYLVSVAGCNDCHTPWAFNKELGAPAPDMTRMLSGHPANGPDPFGKYTPQDMAIIGPTFTAFALPFGIVYAPNLTSDKDTGLGSWTEDMFVKSIRTGRHLGQASARPILPPMPWQNLRNATDADLKSIFAYLKTVPPISNAVPEHKVPAAVLEGMTAAADKMEKGGGEHVKMPADPAKKPATGGVKK